MLLPRVGIIAEWEWNTGPSYVTGEYRCYLLIYLSTVYRVSSITVFIMSFTAFSILITQPFFLKLGFVWKLRKFAVRYQISAKNYSLRFKLLLSTICRTERLRQDHAAAVYRGQAPAGQRADTRVRGQARIQAEVGHNDLNMAYKRFHTIRTLC